MVSPWSIPGGEGYPHLLISQCCAFLQLVLDIHLELFQLLFGNLDIKSARGS